MIKMRIEIFNCKIISISLNNLKKLNKIAFLNTLVFKNKKIIIFEINLLINLKTD